MTGPAGLTVAAVGSAGPFFLSLKGTAMSNTTLSILRDYAVQAIVSLAFLTIGLIGVFS